MNITLPRPKWKSFRINNHKLLIQFWTITIKLDVIEFGPGDATKSVHLLKELSCRNQIANYIPIDISKNIIRLLNEDLPRQIPGLTIHGFAGEYFQMLSAAHQVSSNKKLVLFLGANIGNFKFNEMPVFLQKLRSLLSKGDMVLIGFDLKKNPKKILAAYDDKAGYTREFNLNLLVESIKNSMAILRLKILSIMPCTIRQPELVKAFLFQQKISL